MIVVNGFDGNVFDQRSIEGLAGRFLKCFYRLALSGNSAVGGDALDFTNGGVNSAIPPLARVIEGIAIKGHAGSASSFIGSGGYFAVVGTPGTTGVASWKLIGYAAGGTAQGAVAYSSFTGGSALTDTIELEVTFAR